VLFLHGWGGFNGHMEGALAHASGGKFRQSLEQMHVELIIPNAPNRTLPPPWGPNAPAWFDLTWPLTAYTPEATASAKQTFDEVLAPMLANLDERVGLENVVIGGFSMGGEMALQMLNYAPPNIAGIFSMSAYLQYDSQVWQALKSGIPRPPVWMAHGTADHAVRYRDAFSTYRRLFSEGVNVQFHPVSGMQHSINGEELAALVPWILQQIQREKGAPAEPAVLSAPPSNIATSGHDKSYVAPMPPTGRLPRRGRSSVLALSKQRRPEDFSFQR